MSRLAISYKTQSTMWTVIFLLPTVLLLLTFKVIPMFASFVLSLTNYDGITPPKFVGLQNFKLMLELDLYWIALRNVALFTVEMVIASVVLGLLIGLLLDQQFVGRNLVRTIHMSSMVISLAVMAWIFKMLFSEKWGPLPQFLRTLGLPSIDVLNDPNLAMSGVAIMTVWRGLGYYFIISLAGLQSVNKELHEAASIDGANAVQRFFFVTMPLLRPVILFLTITGVLDAIQLFGQVFVISANPGTPIPPGGPMNSTTTPVLLIYNYAFRFGRAGYASAMAVSLFFIMMIVTLIQARVGGISKGVGQ